MTPTEAIEIRTSVRSYLSQPLTPQQRQQLQKAIDALNRRSGLHFRLICDQPKPFSSVVKTYGILKGVQHFFLLAGNGSDPHLDEKCGYYGQQLVLTATAMGLGTCWVGGTYDRRFCTRFLKTEEKLVCVVALGQADPSRAKSAISRMAAKRGKSVSELTSTLPGAPLWFGAGARAVTRAPSALNRQGYRFQLREDHTVTAKRTSKGALSLVDLGIAKLHFELGAHGGSWSWGDGGVFKKAAEEKSCGAVIWRENDGRREYLLAKHNGGHWSFPKGHVEGNETEEETACREILEETGLVAQVDTGFRHVVSYYPKSGIIKDVIFFLATVSGGTQHAQEEEIAQLGWFSFEDAKARVTFANDMDILLDAQAYLSK